MQLTTTPPTLMSRVRKWAIPTVLAVGAATYGVSQCGPTQPTGPVVVMQDYIAGTEAFQSGHVYEVIQTNNINGRECAIYPADKGEVKYWANTLRDQLHQTIPTTRQSFMPIPATGTDLSLPLPWKMFKGPSTVPSGPIDLAVCTASYTGGTGTSYVKVDITPGTPPTDANAAPPAPTIKVTIVAPTGWPTKSAVVKPAAPAAEGGTAAPAASTANATVTVPKS